MIKPLTYIIFTITLVSCSHYTEKNCFSRPYGKSTYAIQLQHVIPDTLGVFDTGEFKLYFNASEFIRDIQKQVSFCKTDSTNYSSITFPLDSSYDQSSSYRFALTNAMQSNKRDIVVYEKILDAIKSQLKDFDALDFNKFPPFEKQNFNPKEYSYVNYHAENALYYAVMNGEINLYNKMTTVFEKNIIYKMKYNRFNDYEKIYTQDGRLILNLHDL